MLREAGQIINELIHDEIRKLRGISINLTTFDIAQSITAINPELWDFICQCTQSVRGRAGQTNKDDENMKTIRRFFIINMMMYTTNPFTCTTVHHLLADTVEVCGGSRQLLRILNRLGVTVSSDTHDRLVTEVAEREKQKSLWSDLDPNVFTVASTDNIDFLQSHAAVYCGNQSRSYHGTKIQIVQPVPSLKFTTQPITQSTSSSSYRRKFTIKFCT